MSELHERRIRSASDLEIAQRKIFIGGLSYDTDDDNLKRYFAKYGIIDDAVVMKDPISKRSRGFGFITFTNMTSVDDAIADEPHTIDARRVEVKRAVPKIDPNINTLSSSSHLQSKPVTVSTPTKQPLNSPNLTPSSSSRKPISTNISGVFKQIAPVTTTSLKLPSVSSPTKGSRSNSTTSVDENTKFNSEEFANNKIFVGGLHYDIRDGDFKEYFGMFGIILHSEVMINRETHKSRGFGFVIYNSEESVDKVCEQANHVIHGKAVEVKRAIPRSQMSFLSSPSPQSPSLSFANGSSGSGSAKASPFHESPVLNSVVPGSPVQISSPTSLHKNGHVVLPIRATPKRPSSLSVSNINASSPTVLSPTSQNCIGDAVPLRKPSPGLILPPSAVSQTSVFPNCDSSTLLRNNIYSKENDNEMSYLDQIISSLSMSNFRDQESISRPFRAFSEPVLQTSYLNNASNQTSDVQCSSSLNTACGSLFSDTIESLLSTPTNRYHNLNYHNGDGNIVKPENSRLSPGNPPMFPNWPSRSRHEDVHMEVPSIQHQSQSMNNGDFSNYPAPVHENIPQYGHHSQANVQPSTNPNFYVQQNSRLHDNNGNVLWQTGYHNNLQNGGNYMPQTPSQSPQRSSIPPSPGSYYVPHQPQIPLPLLPTFPNHLYDQSHGPLPPPQIPQFPNHTSMSLMHPSNGPFQNYSHSHQIPVNVGSSAGGHEYFFNSPERSNPRNSNQVTSDEELLLKEWRLDCPEFTPASHSIPSVMSTIFNT